MTDAMRPTVKQRIKRTLRGPYLYFSRWLFDPLAMVLGPVNHARSLPLYVSNVRAYSRENARPSMAFRLREAWYRTFDRLEGAGSLTFHYFWQDLWAARKLADAGTRHHVDVGSRVDGFVAHVLAFAEVTYVDVRPLDLEFPGFHFRQGLVTEMPFEKDSVESLSSLHVIEHVGLGRYGDPIDAEGSWKAARELTRILAPGGRLLIGVPTGRERLQFDAHRIFDPQTTRDMFAGLELADFAFVDDRNRFAPKATFEEARRADYGCGLFEFRKPPAHA